MSTTASRAPRTIGELRDLYDAGELTPVDAVEDALARIAGDELRAFAHPRAAEAREEAQRAARRLAAGAPLGPLDGVPVAVKSMVAMAGMPQDAGSRVLEGRYAYRDATLVGALRQAGAVIVGTTTMDEFALTTLGPARNPFDPNRTAGGSSGGSAVAVHAGMCFAAIGTDTGGSVRIPAACCAVVGLKPTYGLLPTDGIIPLAWSLDHAGPIGRTVADVALMLDVLLSGAGDTGGPGDPAAGAGLAGTRIGVPPDEYLSIAEPHVLQDLRDALDAARARGAEIVPVELPDQDEVKAVHWPVLSAEMAAYHLRRFGAAEDRYDAPMRDGIAAGAAVTTEEYLRAQRGRPVLRAKVDEALTGVDVIALPTLAVDPPELGRTEVELDGRSEDAVAAMVRLTSLANHTGHPAVSVPPGTASRGRPAGVQLIGRHYDERRLLAVAAGLEALS
ncbi:aspartyl-tRNA(Asn)/glutamyl-tRNA(Gln) amidotransferase subunit A [Actinomadura pelletieri DSM 43383]|uniref:Aspartyl-tRNA(Asn)/glutamyl-tRNA(Gln) amidotransferase subunit A n=1 Tax=Actinomadura pelletieri DSM 43383 TaxID=1120940 RepID=A0A495QKG9_9ACTN|nr:amidase [Actinomadura pelletieri]RKS73075.1 aspartyl-tRNA(Asn)/glutamyl-tRNA(Gln) amidotransferase subunit A [Actinomadura pelletieri DSM 43383]